MYVIVAEWLVNAGKEDEVAEVLKTAVKNSRREPGCVLFMANRSTENPRKFVLYEQFRDKAAFDAHLQTESFKELVQGKILPHLESRVRGIYDVVEPA